MAYLNIIDESKKEGRDVLKKITLLTNVMFFIQYIFYIYVS